MNSIKGTEEITGMLEEDSSSPLLFSLCSDVQSIDGLPTASVEGSAHEFRPGTYALTTVTLETLLFNLK
jgi:hypothetical protein